MNKLVLLCNSNAKNSIALFFTGSQVKESVRTLSFGKVRMPLQIIRLHLRPVFEYVLNPIVLFEWLVE